MRIKTVNKKETINIQKQTVNEYTEVEQINKKRINNQTENN